MDAAATERAALLGWSEGGSYSAFFAAREPERVSHLILYAAPPRILRTDDYPAGWPLKMFEEIIAGTEATWGTDAVAGWVNPSAAEDEAYRRGFDPLQRPAPGPGRPPLAGLARAPQPGRPAEPPALSRGRGQNHGRRLPRDLRWPGARHPL